MENRLDSPIFVVGTSRSGTTLLYNILLSSGEFPLYEAETKLLDECAIKYGNLKRERNYHKFMKDWGISKQFIRSGMKIEQFQEQARDHCNNYIEFLSFFMDSMAKRQGKKRWAEKTPSHIRHMRELSRAFDNARFIHIIRDGRDVALSRRKLGWIGVRSKDPLKQLLFSAIDWEITVRNGRRMGNKLGSNYLEVRYEDLISNIEDVLTRINQFADVKIDRQKIKDISMGSLRKANTAFGEKMDGISSKAVERWRKDLTEDELTCLNIAIGKSLSELGYNVPERGGMNKAGLYWKATCLKLYYKVLIRTKKILKQKLLIGHFLPTGLELIQGR
ncbi:MAG: sulfotransferase [Nitrospirae bacterium]|nr:sulfotransferase [Nitrospirota bacterium]